MPASLLKRSRFLSMRCGSGLASGLARARTDWLNLPEASSICCAVRAKGSCWDSMSATCSAARRLLCRAKYVVARTSTSTAPQAIIRRGAMPSDSTRAGSNADIRRGRLPAASVDSTDFRVAVSIRRPEKAATGASLRHLRSAI
jgi:hypothetical protein